MPVTKSAEKALQRDRRRAAVNKAIRTKMRRLLRTAITEPTPENIGAAYSIVDRAGKKHTIQKNRAARLKSRLMKAVQKSK